MRRVVGGGVGGAAGVGDDDGAVAEVGGAARAVPSTEKLVATPVNTTVSMPRPRSRCVELAAVEPADPLVGDHEVAVLRGELVDDLRPVAAVDQAVLLTTILSSGELAMRSG